MIRDLRLAIGLSVAAVIVAALVLLAVVNSTSAVPTLPVPSGTVYTLENHLGTQLRDVIIRFSTSSVMTFMGAWTSDAPAATQVTSTSYYCFPLNGCPLERLVQPACSVTYNVTLSPGDYILFIAAAYPPSANGTVTRFANVTVTQAIRLVTPAVNATPVPPVANVTPAEVFWTPPTVGACPA